MFRHSRAILRVFSKPYYIFKKPVQPLTFLQLSAGVLFTAIHKIQLKLL